MTNGEQEESEPHRDPKISHNLGGQVELKDEGRILDSKLLNISPLA